MGAYVTQSRVPLTGISVWSKKNGVQQGPKDLALHAGYAGVQTTTSYRSGQAALAADPMSGEDLDPSDRGPNWATATGSLFDQDQKSVTRSRSSYDNGHTFTSTRQYVQFSHDFREPIRIPHATDVEYYQGPVTLDPAYFGLGTGWTDPSESDIGFYGPRAIAQTLPTNGAAALAVSLAELKREGVPSLLTRAGWSQGTAEALRDANRGGSNELQVTFGIRPIVQEIKNTFGAIARYRRIVDQFQRDSGKHVRRSFTFPTEYKTLGVAKGTGRVRLLSPYSSITSDAFQGGETFGVQNESLTSEKRVWFSGAYTYHVPSGDRLAEQLMRYEQLGNQLFGIRITPDVLWNLQPWSWLADWELNIGDNIANLSALSNDGLVIVYGYLTVYETIRHTITVEGPTMKSGGYSRAYNQTFVSERKQRFKATPYGFGRNPQSFSEGQWAILGALGLTKGGKTLR